MRNKYFPCIDLIYFFFHIESMATPEIQQNTANRNFTQTPPSLKYVNTCVIL